MLLPMSNPWAFAIAHYEKQMARVAIISAEVKSLTGLIPHLTGSLAFCRFTSTSDIDLMIPLQEDMKSLLTKLEAKRVLRRSNNFVLKFVGWDLQIRPQSEIDELIKAAEYARQHYNRNAHMVWVRSPRSKKEKHNYQNNILRLAGCKYRLI
jgi:hypothetical protein